MSARECNVNFELLQQPDDIEPVEREKRVGEPIQLVDLADPVAKYPRQLSGGIKMRTSLARSDELLVFHAHLDSGAIGL